MVNRLSINALYNEQRHLIVCARGDFLREAAAKFQIDNIQNVELYCLTEDGERRRIVEYDIVDMMRIELVNKRTRNGEQRTIDSYIPPKFRVIISKLKNNNSLSGQERKDLIALIQSNQSVVSNKRKFDEVSPESKKIHKKVQVNMPFTNSKESTTQTDKITLPVSLNAQEIRDELKREVSKAHPNKQKIARLMADSYYDRSSLIKYKSPLISQIKELYPPLFDLNGVKNELCFIFHSEKPQEFIKNMFKYAPLIVQKCKSPDLQQRTKKSMDRVSTSHQKKYAEVVGSVYILTELMDEEWRFIHLQDYPSGSDDIYPHIDASCHRIKETFSDNCLYSIKVEGYKLCEANNFMEAILCLTAAFFILNIEYPPSCRRTMIMFEKLYLQGNDTVDIDEHTSQMLKLLELEGRAQNSK